MKLRIAVLLGLALSAVLLLWPRSNSVSANATTDPCVGTVLKSSVAISTNPADLVAPVSGKTIYVCGFGFGNSSTNGTERLGAETIAGQCASGTDTQLTGNLALSTSPIIVGNARQTVLVAPSGSGLCSAGSTSAGNGYVTYVQE